MSEEVAMLLAAAIGVSASLLTLIITRIFDIYSEKKKEQERFFYEIYGRRLELYRKILKQIHLFDDTVSSDPADSPDVFANVTTAFIELSSRGVLVASIAVADILNDIDKFLSKWIAKGKGRTPAREDFDTLLSFFTKHLALLRDRIREETCPALVDKYLSELTRNEIKHRGTHCRIYSAGKPDSQTKKF